MGAAHQSLAGFTMRHSRQCSRRAPQQALQCGSSTHSSQAGFPVRHSGHYTACAAQQSLAVLTVRHSGHLLEWSKARWKHRRQKLWPQGVVIG